VPATGSSVFVRPISSTRTTTVAGLASGKLARTLFRGIGLLVASRARETRLILDLQVEAPVEPVLAVTGTSVVLSHAFGSADTEASDGDAP
jgi:hypothetical protein